MTTDAIGSDGLRIVEHAPRRGCGLQGMFLQDWQRDQGAAMDAPAWHPLGATQGKRMDWEGCTSPYCLRTGHTFAPPAPAAVRLIHVKLRGVTYRVRFEPTDRRGVAEYFIHPVEVRALAKGARALAPRSKLRREVESLALSEHLSSDY